MTAYVDSSVILRVVLRQHDRLREWRSIRRGIASALVGEMTQVEITTPILSRAAQPLPVPLGTLDAIHLATALAWQDRESASLVMATHDDALALAARASGLRVVGV